MRMLMFLDLRERSIITAIRLRSLPGTGRYVPADRSIVRSAALSFAFTVLSINLMESPTWEHGL